MTLAVVPRLAIAALLAVLAAPFAGALPFGTLLVARAQKDTWMRHNPNSPFNQPSHEVGFAPLKYFAPEAGWVFESKLTVRAGFEPVTILDTDGLERKGRVYGSLKFEKGGAMHTVRVYEMETDAGRYHAVWFTDRTTGDSTYEVGRYLDFKLSEDPDHVYTLDFNKAYNPYCAYTPAYGCAIPRKEDFLDLSITAGEKKWHE